MSLKRTMEAQLPRATVLLIAVTGAFGCSPYPTLKVVPINCSVTNAYEFDPNPVNATNASSWYTASDALTPDAGVIVTSETIEGGLCNDTTAGVFHALHDNDWGALFGYSNFGPRSESTYEGLSFWARAPGNTGKSFTLVLDDANTFSASDTYCKPYNTDAAVPGQAAVTVYDPSTGTVIQVGAIGTSVTDQCGNGYAAVMFVTADWVFYTVPFSAFAQSALPNRVPNSILTDAGSVPGSGLLTNDLRGLTLRVPKEARMDLWIDQMAFYRKKAQPDAGVASDAALN